jgi:hypothetical protein
MRNRQVGPDVPVLADLVKRLTYKPTWTFELKEIARKRGSEGLTLLIGANVPNSLDGGATSVDILHLMPVPPSDWDEESWSRWLLDQILLVEQHEAMEFFRVGGEAMFFPEHAHGRNWYTVAQVKDAGRVGAVADVWSEGPPESEHFQ